MSSFTEELEVRVLNRSEHGRRCVQNLKRFAFEIFFLGSGDLVEIEAGAISDFGSLPRLAWLIDPPFGSCAKSDFVHDDLYRHAKRKRAFADWIWLQAMHVEAAALKAAGQDYAPAWWRFLRYLVVRAFGWRSYGARHPRNRPAPAWRIAWARVLGWGSGILFCLAVWWGLLAFLIWAL